MRKYYLGTLLLSTYYLSFYIARYSIVPLAPLFIEELNLTFTDIGSIISLLYTGYILALTASGILSDILGSFKTILFGVISTSLANIVIPLYPTTSVLKVLVFLNGFGQGMIWPSLMNIISKSYEKESLDYVIGALLTSALIGPSASFLIIGIIASLFNWKLAFTISPIFLIVLTPLVFRNFNLSIISSKKDNKFIINVLKMRNIWLLALTYFCYYSISKGFLGWLPTYLTEKYGFKVPYSSFLSSGLLILSALGALIGTWISKTKTSKKNVMKYSFTLTALIGILLFILEGPDLLLLSLFLFFLSFSEWFYSRCFIIILH